MTISSTNRKAGPYSGNDITTAFPFSFKVFQASEVLAVRLDSATGTESVLVLASDYTVTLNADQNATPGGTVTMLAALATGTTLTLTSSLAYLQPTDLTNNGGFYPAVINAAMDRMVIFCQQLAEKASRSLRFAVSDTSIGTELPGVMQRANNLLGFDASGNPVAVAPAAQSATALQTLLAASPGAAMLGFHSSAGRTVEQQLDMLYFGVANPLDPQYAGGADPTGVLDSSTAIIAALASSSLHTQLSPGIYRCDVMIELNTGKTLQLMAGVTLVRKAAGSISTDPVVWMRGSSAALFGDSFSTSKIQTENKCPRGVVRLGHKDMTESHANVTYCTLRGLDLIGMQDYGQTTGEPDVALYMPNPQFGGLASYFHNITSIRVYRANFGIWMHGWANGNLISKIHGYRIGNVTLGLYKNALIYCNGGLDNAVSDVFFHGSPNSIGLLVDELDNTANGGFVHTSQYNSFKGICCEQGGVSALGLKSIKSLGSYYEVRNNVAGGDSVEATFYDSNTLFRGGNSPTFNALTAKTLVVDLGADGLLAYFRGASNAGVVISGGTYAGVAIAARIAHSSGNRPLVYEVTGIGFHAFYTAAVERLRIDSAGVVRPGADNTQTLGAAAYRWSTVYAGTATINTSDEREKQQIAPIDDAAIRAVRKVDFKQFKFNDAVAEKGTEARWHFGVIAQQVKAAFESEGLNPFAYGVLCYDEWDDVLLPVEATRTIQDAEGNPAQETYETGEFTLVLAAGNRYGVRYEELLCLKIAALA